MNRRSFLRAAFGVGVAVPAAAYGHPKAYSVSDAGFAVSVSTERAVTCTITGTVDWDCVLAAVANPGYIAKRVNGEIVYSKLPPAKNQFFVRGVRKA